MKRRVMTEKEKVANRVYKTEEYLEILKDVMEDQYLLYLILINT